MNAKKTVVKNSQIETALNEKEASLLDLLKGDVASTADAREGERRAKIDKENREYAAAIDKTMQLLVSAGARGPEDLSDAVATQVFRDALKGFKYPAFEELNRDGTPRLRPAGDRLDGLRITTGGKNVYHASSIGWRISKILKMLRAKTDIPWFSWERGGDTIPKSYVADEPAETLAEVAEITLPKTKKGRPTTAAKKLASAKARQRGKDAK